VGRLVLTCGVWISHISHESAANGLRYCLDVAPQPVGKSQAAARAVLEPGYQPVLDQQWLERLTSMKKRFSAT